MIAEPIESKTTAIERARRVALRLNPNGANNFIIAIVCEAITQAEAEARQEERRRVMAEILAEAVPERVLQLAAELVTGRGY